MKALEHLSLGLLHRLDPERAHSLALAALRAGLAPRAKFRATPRLQTDLAGLDLPNPVGLAAGFDKNGVALGGIAQVGFGFVEIGAATPRPQPGNPRPRLFRLSEDRAVINRFGFNNDGASIIAARLARRPAGMICGLNLGANKDSADRAGDFARVLETCGTHIDFATVNVSSPNTERLRDLQGHAALAALLARVLEVRDGLARRIPVFLKIAPDLTADELAQVAATACETGVDAIIATNTTITRPDLKSALAGEQGGLSGAPLFELSTRVLAQLSMLTDGKLPLIGVGGIESAETAYAKIRAGATAVQLYSGMVYQGLGLVGEITQGLEALLERDGFKTIGAVVGSGRGEWL